MPGKVWALKVPFLLKILVWEKLLSFQEFWIFDTIVLLNLTSVKLQVQKVSAVLSLLCKEIKNGTALIEVLYHNVIKIIVLHEYSFCSTWKYMVCRKKILQSEDKWVKVKPKQLDVSIYQAQPKILFWWVKPPIIVVRIYLHGNYMINPFVFEEMEKGNILSLLYIMMLCTVFINKYWKKCFFLN